MKDKIITIFNDIKKKIAVIWPKKINWLWTAIFILVIFCLISIISYWFVSSKQVQRLVQESLNIKIIHQEKQTEKIPAHYIRRHIDGVYVEPELADIYPVAVIIDNDPAARPQSGLAKANLVYEALAESGITRFLAVFASGEEIDSIGPVRSSRPYFLDWSECLDALHVHVGGSPQALAQIKSDDVFNLNEYYQGKYFWRSDYRQSPHNVYISADSINKYLTRLNVQDSDYESWSYKKEETQNTEDTESQSITIDFSVPKFKVRWEYGIENNEYIRYQGGVLHKDADDTQITAKNIVLIYVHSKVIDEELRRNMTTIGSGKAIYCFDGRCEEGKWKKTSVREREKILDKQGEEVLFNAGTTWIEGVQNEIEIKIE